MFYYRFLEWDGLWWFELGLGFDGRSLSLELIVVVLGGFVFFLRFVNIFLG